MRKVLFLIPVATIIAVNFAFAQPANDDCVNAVTLTPSPNTTCTPTAGTNEGVVSTDYDGCAEFSKRNVWYRFTATAGTHVVRVTFGTMQQGIINAFSNGCASLTHMTCGTSGQNGPVIERVLNGLTIGQEYHVAVSTREQSEEGTFSICIITPQPPANDDCAAAVALTVNPSNVPTARTSGTTLFATQTLPGCTGTADDDVWYSFTATQPSHRIHLFYTSSFFSVEAFSGSCGSLVSIHCSSPSGQFKTASLSGLIPGQVYFIRVYSFGNAASEQGSFSIAVASAPQNDECTNAVNVTPSVNGNDACATSVAGGTFDGTMSSLSCFGDNSTINDTWFSFVATQGVHKIKVHGFGSNVIRMQTFSGACGSLTSLKCEGPVFAGDTAITIVGGLTAGQTYFVRVYSGNSGGVEGLFNICVTSPVFPPNDECINAVTLTPTSDSTLNYTNGTLIGATGINVPGSCGGNTLDVWYKFTATSAQHVVKLVNLTNAQSLSIELFFGSCGTLVHQRCGVFNDSLFGIGNLTIGQTYFIRAITSSVFVGDDFKVAVFTPQALFNDECAAAATIVPAADASCNEVGGTILGATQSQKENVCGGNALIGQVSDVWYRFVATSASHRVRLIKGTGSLAFQVLSGTCGALVNLGCSAELTGVEGSSTEVRYDGLTIGNTYFVRVLNTAPSVTGTFDICVKTVVIPINNECAAATILIPQNNITFGNFTSGITTDATTSPEPTSCSTGQDDDVWYQFTATQANMQVLLQNSTISTTRIAVYSGTCGALVLVKCQAGNTRDNVVTLTGLTIGTAYLVRVYSSSTSAAAQGTFSIMVTTQYNPPANDDCVNSTELFPSANNTCTTVKGSTIDAGPSGNSVCINGNEVWYRFVATATSHRVNLTGFVNTPMIVLFSGSCAALTQVPSTCAAGSNHVSVTANSLTIGNTYFIKIAANSTAAFAQSFFNICITTPQVPSNNECAGAIALAVDNDGNTEQGELYSTNLATFSGVPNCAVFGNDVWFSFVAPNDPVTVEVNALNNDAAIELLSGTCGSLVSVLCNGDNVNRTNNILNANNLQPGTTYFARVSSTSFSAGLEFNIKVYKNPSLKLNSSIDSACLTSNLVINPGVEIDFLIPTSFIGAANPGTEIIYGWRLPTRGTADFFNGLNAVGSAVEAPANICLGRQSPRNGYGYGGFFAYTSSSSSYREYLETSLTAPMIPGRRYLVSCYVSLADFSTIAIDNIGLALRTSATREVTFTNLPFTPQVLSPDNVFITDRKGWVNISAVITADQPYSHLVIGNFRNNGATDTIRVADTSAVLSGGSFAGCATIAHSAYYFVDDVMVSEINGAVSGCGVLPLNLLRFTGRRQGGDIALNWRTTNEVNTSRFEIQRSDDGISYSVIGTVASFNRPGDHDYALIDPRVAPGVHFYRLRMIDADGRFTYSAIVRIVIDDDKAFRIYPNPAKDLVQVETTIPYHSIRVTDMMGRTSVVWRKTANGQYDISKLPPGVYVLKILGDDLIKTYKLVKE